MQRMLHIIGAVLTLNVLVCIGLQTSCKPVDKPIEPDVPKVHKSVTPVTMSSLLDEMVSFDESVYYPSPYYTASQASSTDIRSKSPTEPYWFGNKDNTRYLRVDNDNVDGRYEKVIFDQTGAGAITRIWTTGIASTVQIRFYFDGEKSPRLTLSGNDLTRLPFDVPEPLLQKHLYYAEKGGTSLHLPIPYASGCKITLYPTSINLAYHIGYRSYEEGTEVETFTIEGARNASAKMSATVATLNAPTTYSSASPLVESFSLEKGASKTIDLPDGAQAVRTLRIKVKNFSALAPEVLMRKIVLRMSFDGRETVWVPLGDFTGGGIGSRAVDNWYMDSDGCGSSVSRWIMPYKTSAQITLDNYSTKTAEIELTADTDAWEWCDNTLYFHCSWRQANVAYKSDYESNNNDEWLFSSLSGRGVYKGDVLSLFNYGGSWFGEGDEKIYVDDEKFPSHFGTGTEDYYDTSFAPVTVYQTPFGGVARADTDSSYGYNTFLRTRNIDGITFGSSLKFYFELLGWSSGSAIYSSTVFWYGDVDASAIQCSATEEIERNLPH